MKRVRRGASRSGAAVMVLLLLFAAAIRLVRLGEPEALIFDETYYAKDACIYLELGRDRCGLNQDVEQSYVHPPTGKWLIAAGIKLFGYDSFGQRFIAALFGVGPVLLVYLLAERLFRKRWISIVAAALVATDFLLLVQSRIAMLDIFLAFFVVLGFLFVARDRERVVAIKDGLVAGTTSGVPARGMANRLLAGAALGAALSVKWSAIYAVLAAALLCLSWSYGLAKLRRRGGGPAAGTLSDVVVGLLLAAIAFGAVPLAVYLASYADFYGKLADLECAYTVPDRSQERFFGEGFNGHVAGECLTGFTGMALNLADVHQRMAEYHLTLKATHLYQSKAWSWPLVLRPVAYHWAWDPAGVGEPDRRIAHITAMGNVVTWYGALAAAVWLVVRSVRKWRPESIVAAAWAAQYVPWLLVSRPLFFFYMTPVVPFMMIGLAAALNSLRAKRLGALLVVVYLALAAMVFVLFFPVVTGIEIPYDRWRMLMWIPSFDCGGLKCGWI